MSWSFGCFGISAKPSIVPFLFVGQVVFMLVVMHAAGEKAALSGSAQWNVFGLLIVLVVWGLVSSVLGVSGVYVSPGLMKSYLGLWLPLVPVVLVAVFFAASEDLRDTLIVIVDKVDQKWFVLIQGFRALAVGTVVKAFRGSFPRIFGFTVGGMDMLYGISAWILFIALGTGSQVSTPGLFTWHLLGIFIIIPAAPIVMQLSLPGFFFSHESSPSMSSVFEFPMVLAPSLIVPVFLGLNALMVWRLGVDL